MFSIKKSCVCMWVFAWLYVRAYVHVLRMRMYKTYSFCLRDSYGTAHNKSAIPTLHCFYSHKLNYTLPLLPQKQKDWSVCTCQRSLLSVHDSSYSSRNLRNPHQTAQPSAARSVFLNNSGNICRIGLACAAIYSLRVSFWDSDTFLLLGIHFHALCAFHAFYV